MWSENSAKTLVDDGWRRVESLPLQSWDGISQSLERLIILNSPDIRVKFMTWFKPMNFDSAWEKATHVLVLLNCSSAHRAQEVEKIQPAIESFLAMEAFKDRSVTIHLMLDEDEPDVHEEVKTASTSASASGSPDPLSSSPLSLHAKAPDPVGDEKARSEGQNDEALSKLDYYRRRLGIEITAQDLSAVLTAIEQADPARLKALESERLSPKAKSSGVASRAQARIDDPVEPAVSAAPLSDIEVDPTYATMYDEIVHGHSAIYLPAYFVRHLRHMGASDGLKYMSLRQIAYKRGFKDVGGSRTVQATLSELVRWSTLSKRLIPGNLDNPQSYLFLLAGKTSYISHWETLPASEKWEDKAGYHWKTKDRAFIIWKKDGQPGDDCSQLYTDPKAKETSWRQAPSIYRVQMSMPLAPEDAQSLRESLVSFGVSSDPLGAIQQCLALSRDELIPDRPRKLEELPRKLYTVQELVMEAWGLADRSIAAKVAAQSKVLEEFLIQPRSLLKIPFYLLDKWGPYLSPAQLWSVIILMDRVYADNNGNEYRDTTLIKKGTKEMALWLDEEFTPGATKKIEKWLRPYNLAPKEDDRASSFSNPWFSVFVSEVRDQTGSRPKNSDQSTQLRLKVLPIVPLAPEDTLLFAQKMGMTRFVVRDAEGNMLGIELTVEHFIVYTNDGRTLRFSYSGELLSSQTEPIVLKSLDRNLEGIELLTDKKFYDPEVWGDRLFCNLEKGGHGLFCDLESQGDGLSCDLGKEGHGLFRNLENQGDGIFCNLALGPDGLFCVLLKLLILNLYGIKNNSIKEESSSIPKLSDDVDSLEQYGARQGYYMQWTEESPDSDWDFDKVSRSLGITDIKSLKEAGVSAESMVACAMELYVTPKEKFNTSRVAVLVAKLRRSPDAPAGAFQRLAAMGPEMIQSLFRRAITSWITSVQDPDWDVSLAKAKREDLIELTEKLALGRVFSLQESE